MTDFSGQQIRQAERARLSEIGDAVQSQPLIVGKRSPDIAFQGQQITIIEVQAALPSRQRTAAVQGECNRSGQCFLQSGQSGEKAITGHDRVEGQVEGFPGLGMTCGEGEPVKTGCKWLDSQRRGGFPFGGADDIAHGAEEERVGKIGQSDTDFRQIEFFEPQADAGQRKGFRCCFGRRFR